MRLQQATRLALYSVLVLARDPTRQLAVAEIADGYDISIHHLAKVLRTLGRAGLVEAVRGVGGGYRFTGNAKRVTVFDVISLFEDVANPAPDDHDVVTPAARALGLILAEIDEHAVATFRSVSISTMLKIIERTSQRATADRSKGSEAQDSLDLS